MTIKNKKILKMYRINTEAYVLTSSILCQHAGTVHADWARWFSSLRMIIMTREPSITKLRDILNDDLQL